jgi:hypothetical protein
MLTDFSENANHAVKTAARVVPQLKADNQHIPLMVIPSEMS